MNQQDQQGMECEGYPILPEEWGDLEHAEQICILGEFVVIFEKNVL